MSVNKVILMGRVGEKPCLSSTKNGYPLCTFELGTSESYRAQGGAKGSMWLWHKVVIFGALAGRCHRALRKGSLVYLEGRNNPKIWTDQKGQEHFSHEVVGSFVKFFTKRVQTEAHSGGDVDETE